MKQLAKNIFQINTGKANVFLIKGNKGLMLIDAGVVGIKNTLEQTLNRNGLALSDVSHILVTHAHVDHVGGLAELQEATRAEVWVHILDAPMVRGEQPVLLPRALESNGARSHDGRHHQSFCGFRATVITCS